VTQNSQAYELYLRGMDHYRRYVRVDFDTALTLFAEAVKLDPHFVSPYAQSVFILTELHRMWDNNPQLLDRADEAVANVIKIEGETARSFWLKADVLWQRGNSDKALEVVNHAIALDPNLVDAYSLIGYIHLGAGRNLEAAKAFEHVIELSPNDHLLHWDLECGLEALGDTTKLRSEAQRAIPSFEKQLHYYPDDTHARVNYAYTLFHAGQRQDAINEAEKLNKYPTLDAFPLQNLSLLYGYLKNYPKLMEIFRQAAAAKYGWLAFADQEPKFAPLYHDPEFIKLVREAKVYNKMPKSL